MQRSFTFVLLLVVCLVCLGPLAAQDAPTPEPVGLRPDAPQYALHGPYWVGKDTWNDQTEFHRTNVLVWYPALNPDGQVESINYVGFGMPIEGRALNRAAPDSSGGPYPLVVLAHGLGGSNTMQAYLGEHLASEGFVVMAINYGDSGEQTGGADPALAMYTRPRDVSWQIDLAEQLNAEPDNVLYQLLDTERVAVVGHSNGGYTALAAGGAQVDLTGPTSWCVLKPNMELAPEVGGGTPQQLFCNRTEELAALSGLENVPEERWPSWGDPRVDAIVPLAPIAFYLGADSAAAVTVPTLLIIGSGDRIAVSTDENYVPNVYDGLGSTHKAIVTVENADHSVFNFSCETAPGLVEVGAFWACSDPVWDMDRAHDLINHFTTAFLLDTLKGDAAAHAALAPDAVAFPGIEYQAEGF
jgi:predicted dienelactone hydrolase